jgi:hypothetical protein
MSSNYALVGLGMAAAGVLTDVFGARTIWVAAGAICLVGALVALVMTRWLPVRSEEERAAIEESAESAVALLGNGNGQRVSVPEPEFAPDTGLERIARLMEEIEARRALEARARSDA